MERKLLPYFLLSLPFLGSPAAALAATQDPAAPATAEASIQLAIDFLAGVMDQFHHRFPVYDDVSSAGNHFHVYAKIPSPSAAVSLNGSWTADRQAGATALRCEFQDIPGPNFGGFYFLNGVLPDGAIAPMPNFGEVPNAGINLSGVTEITFWAKGHQGGEKIEFFVAGVGRDSTTGQPLPPPVVAPDSSPRHPPQGTIFTLTSSWQPYSINVSSLNLSYVLGGFAWVADDVRNPGGAVFYLDSIEYHLSPQARATRLNVPRFLTSYITLPLQPDPFDPNLDDDIDLVLRNMAFAYDNALALLAFLAHRSPDSLRRARLLGDAFVYALSHDRFFDFEDGRIRTGYAAGDIALPPGWIPNGRLATVPAPGFFYEANQTFFEVEQDVIDAGNNAWVMIALLALHRETGNTSYFTAARSLGEFLRTCRNNAGAYQGFQGGFEGEEDGNPVRRPWASGEHNLDIYAAFRRMFEVTGEPQWQNGANHARSLIEDLWDADLGCYLAGTLDPQTLNQNFDQVPLDVQAWSVLALPDVLIFHPDVLACAETHHRTVDQGFTGYDFNTDQDRVWFEGTGQMATAYALAGEPLPAEALRDELRQAQSMSPYGGPPPFGSGRGLAAASRDGLTTGFDFKYFRRLHIAAAAWNVFAQLRFNPYYQLGPIFGDGFESGSTSAWSATVP